MCRDQKECPFLGLGRENIFLSRDCLNFRSRSKKCQYTLSFSGSPVPFFPQRGKTVHCVSPPTGGRRKKTLFLNFQRTQITQRKQKQRWSEIILELNIRLFSFFKISRKSGNSRNVQNFQWQKAKRPCGLYRRKMFFSALALFCSFFSPPFSSFFSIFVPGRELFFNMVKIPINCPFPRTSSSPFFNQIHFLFCFCLPINPHQIS